MARQRTIESDDSVMPDRASRSRLAELQHELEVRAADRLNTEGSSMTNSGVERRDQIVSAAAELFSAQGFAETSMDEIASAVGIAKATLYHYFTSKNEILGAIENTFIDVAIARQQRRTTDRVEPGEQLLGVMQDILGLMESHREFVRVYLSEHREPAVDDLPAQAKSEVRRKRDLYEQLVTDVVSAGMQDGSFRAGDPHLTALALFGMCNWAYRWWPRMQKEWSSEDVARVFHGILVNGITAER